MDLIKYNKDYAISADGFMNLGNTCYFNSLIQSILSCTSLMETISEIKPNNNICKELYKIYMLNKANKSISQCTGSLLNELVNFSKKRKDRVPFNPHNQQDSHEGLMFFLEAIEKYPELKRLFEHRHRVRIRCFGCKKTIVDKFEMNKVIEIEPDFINDTSNMNNANNLSMDLNEFILRQNASIDENYKCSNGCDGKTKKIKVTELVMAPEIIPIVIKKYMRKILTPYPIELTFRSTLKGKKMLLVYKIVAISDHSGGMDGGHYWARCLRTDGWKELNDSSVSDSNPLPTVSSYILFYHFFGYRNI